MNEYYVYVYLDVRKPGSYVYENVRFEYEPFYVGKGCGDRCYTHLEESSNIKNDEHRHRKIRKIIQETGNEPEIIKVKNGMNTKDALALETHLIKIIGREDLHKGPLLNKTDGGDGLVNPGLETRKKFSIIRKEWMSHPENKARIYTTERARKISDAMTGKKKSPEHIAKLPQNQKGYKHSEEFREEKRKQIARQGGILHGESLYDVWIRKYGKAKADARLQKYKKILSQRSSENNIMRSKSVYDCWVGKYGKDTADEKWRIANKKRSKSLVGKKKSSEWKKKLSEAAKKRWQREREKIISNNEEVEI